MFPVGHLTEQWWILNDRRKQVNISRDGMENAGSTAYSNTGEGDEVGDEA
ncbi:hypothetical protein HRbin02_01888 [Candidatus Calditenuaceae archaeon HR02]|nr:hypothetical protein HRbin02_01888 [Candidatus Calditenuaceae archaeon HR02]